MSGMDIMTSDPYSTTVRAIVRRVKRFDLGTFSVLLAIMGSDQDIEVKFPDRSVNGHYARDPEVGDEVVITIDKY